LRDILKGEGEMGVLLQAETVQILGAAIILLAFLQISLTLYNSFRRNVHRARMEGLSFREMEEKVEIASAAANSLRTQVSLNWNGFRKFRVEKKVQEGGDICSFYLVPHSGRGLPPFKPGQYLTFQLKMDGSDKPLTRCYSLSDSPIAPEYYRVSIKRVPPPPKQPELPPGQSSNYFHDHVVEGDILDVKAPSGNFYLDMTKNTPVVLIGGGVGLTPVLSMLNAICESGSKREVWFFYGVRNGAEHIMKEHLTLISQKYDNVHVRVCYSEQGDEEVLGQDFNVKGWVCVDLFKKELPSNNYDFLICGPPPMMNALTSDLKDWGVPKDKIHFEAFGPASVKKIAPAPSQESFNVHFAKSNKTIVWDGKDASLLEFAENNGIPMDSGCRAGNCGTCVSAMIDGEVEYINEPGALPEKGSCLTCVSVPKGDLTLEA
jgi:uncharacterized protein